MSVYEYTDEIGWKIRITRSMGAVWVAASPEEGVQTGVEVKPEDAPAVALAILEAAGIDPDDVRTGPEYTREAVYHLQRHKRELDEAQAREAEDAKVAEYRAHRMKVIGARDPDGWWNVPESSRKAWRQEFSAAREFFTRDEKSAPRVLNYGDPEPDRGTKWRDKDGDLWRHDGRGWHWVPTVRMCAPNRRDWTAIEAGYFPMTEVTP